MVKIKQECQDCDGTGTKTDDLGNPTVECNICKGDGWIPISRINLTRLDIIISKLDEILAEVQSD